jgi:predicted secreted protein
MKLRLNLPGLLLISLLLSALASPAVSGQTQMTILTQKDNGREITVPLGAVIQIELAAAGGAGYLWELADLDPEHLQLLKTETVNADKPGITGAPNVRRWQLKTKQRGQADLKFYYFRPWEGKDKALDRFYVKIRIT